MRMGTKLLPLTILVVFVQIASYGQRQLSLTPALGIAWPFSYAIERPVGDIGYHQYSNLGISFNVNTEYQFNQNWTLFGGWHFGYNTAFHLGYGDPKRDFKRGRLGNSATTHRLQLGGLKYLSTQKWFKLKHREMMLRRTTVRPKDDLLYLMLFRLRALSGLSYNYIVPSTYENVLRGFTSGTSIFTIENRSSLSMFFGLNLQFFNYDKNHFQLSFIYSQGLTQVLNADIDYQLPSGNYETKIGSRGSFFLIQLGYPIKLIDFEKRSRKNHD